MPYDSNHNHPLFGGVITQAHAVGFGDKGESIMIFGCIVAVIVLFVLLAIPYMISYKIACEYARTLPEEEREKFWNEYIIELTNDQYRGI